jgi:hypothetical protein
MDEFCRKYSKHITRSLPLPQKDAGQDGQQQLRPVYMIPFIPDELDGR